MHNLIDIQVAKGVLDKIKRRKEITKNVLSGKLTFVFKNAARAGENKNHKSMNVPANGILIVAYLKYQLQTRRCIMAYSEESPGYFIPSQYDEDKNLMPIEEFKNDLAFMNKDGEWEVIKKSSLRREQLGIYSLL